MTNITGRVTYLVQVTTEDMFGEMQQYEDHFFINSMNDLEHQVFELYGTSEFKVLESYTPQTNVIS